MTLQFACVMESPDHIDRIPIGTAAVDDDVTGVVDDSVSSPGAVATEAQMVGANALCEIRPLLRAWPLGTGQKVLESLHQQSLIAQGGLFAEPLFAPFQSLANVAPCRR